MHSSITFRQRLMLWHILNCDHSAQMLDECSAELDEPDHPEAKEAGWMWDWWSSNLSESEDALRTLADAKLPLMVARRLRAEAALWARDARAPLERRASTWAVRRLTDEIRLLRHEVTWKELLARLHPPDGNEHVRESIAHFLALRADTDAPRLANQLCHAARDEERLLCLARRQFTVFGLTKRKIEWALDQLALRTLLNKTRLLDELLHMLVNYGTRALHSDHYENVANLLPPHHRRRVYRHFARFVDVAFGECPGTSRSRVVMA